MITFELVIGTIIPALWVSWFAAVAFVVKSRAEEARMRATFPEYDSYAQQTSAIIPYVY